MQLVQILTGMANRAIPSEAKRLRLDEYMKIRGVEPKELAAEIDTTPASISRWSANKRVPRQPEMRALEEYFGVGPGGLYQPPENAPESALLKGLDKAKREEAMNFLAFLRQRK